jgi:hypothetical protein
MVEVVAHAVLGRRLPVDELDGGLERGVAAAHPVVLGQAEVVEEGALQVGHRGFAHADPGNGLGLHQGDVHAALERFRKIRGRHPSGGPAAEDHHSLDKVVLRNLGASLHVTPPSEIK